MDWNRVAENLLLMALGAVAIAAVLVHSAKAHGQETGEIITAGHYCNTQDEDLVRRFTHAMAGGGIEAYVELMNSPAIPCYDVRMHPRVSPVQLILVEKMWSFDMQDIGEVIVWKVEDSAGQTGYTWVTKVTRRGQPSTPI